MKRYNLIKERSFKACYICNHFIKSNNDCDIFGKVYKAHGDIVIEWLSTPYWENLCDFFEIRGK